MLVLYETEVCCNILPILTLLSIPFQYVALHSFPKFCDYSKQHDAFSIHFSHQLSSQHPPFIFFGTNTALMICHCHSSLSYSLLCISVMTRKVASVLPVMESYLHTFIFFLSNVLPLVFSVPSTIVQGFNFNMTGTDTGDTQVVIV